MEVNILTYGGIIQSIVVPDTTGQLGDITLGFDDLEDYLKPQPLFRRDHRTVREPDRQRSDSR